MNSCLPVSPHSGHAKSYCPRLLIFALFFGACFSAQAADSAVFKTLAPATANLNQYQWNSRPLVVFAPSEKDANYQQQMAMLRNNLAGLKERNIVVLTDTSPAHQGILRSQLNPTRFEVVLVGKDGGMKLRDTSPLSSDLLFATIDKMPMRQNGGN